MDSASQPHGEHIFLRHGVRPLALWWLPPALPFPPSPMLLWAGLGWAGVVREREEEVGSDPIVSTLGQVRTIPIFGSGSSCRLLRGLLGPRGRRSAKETQAGRGRALAPRHSIQSVRPGGTGCWSLPVMRAIASELLLGQGFICLSRILTWPPPSLKLPMIQSLTFFGFPPALVSPPQ